MTHATTYCDVPAAATAMHAGALQSKTALAREIAEARTKLAQLLELAAATDDSFDAGDMFAMDGLQTNDLTWRQRNAATVKARQALLQLVERQQMTEATLHASLAELRLRESALNAITQGVLISDALGRTTYMNQACEEITGYSDADMTGRSAAMLQGPDTCAETVQAIRHAMAQRLPFHDVLLNYRKDGKPFWNDLTVVPVFNAQGEVTQFVGVMRDVTVQHQLEAQQWLATKLFERSSEGFIVTDADSNIVRVNQAFTDICGYSEAEVLGRNPRLLSSQRHDKVFFDAMWDDVRANGHWQGEVWNRRKDGAIYPQWLSLGHVLDSAGRVSHYIATFSDMTQRKEAADHILKLAHFDLLTGLPNRTLLNDRANQALQMARRSKEGVALMFIDLDHFKNINDTLGHYVGDRLLASLAERFKLALRDQDTFSRWGGDEFVLLLPGTTAANAGHVAQKLLDLTQHAHDITPHELTITTSIGIAVFPSDGEDFETLAKCADAAMYRAKQSGRNRACFYTPEIQDQSARTLLLDNHLRRALAREQLQLHYQPQRSLHTGEIVGAEALLRWQHPELGWVSPGEFIPIAENNGLITGIGEWVLRTVVRQIRVWQDLGMPEITVAVNVSTVQFRQQNLPELVKTILAESGVAPQCLELELTESMASSDPQGAIAVMNELRACGVRLSIDDFGTGYSSLSYLKKFKINKLKIDQSFVAGLTEDNENQAIVSAIISLANSLGLQTIAEGVETPAQMEYLRTAGCHEMQGYLLSRPLAVSQFEAFMFQTDP